MKVYPASRDSKDYLNSLNSIRLNQDQPYNLVSIIGGLSFLHAINENIENLILVDNQNACCEYAQSIIDIIKDSNNLAAFSSSIRKYPYNKELFPTIKEFKNNFKINLLYSQYSLKVYNFNWLIGFGSFTNNDSFLKLKLSINKANIVIKNNDITELCPYLNELLQPNKMTNNYILVGNANSDMFGNDKGVLQKSLMKHISFDFHLVQWSGVTVFQPNNHHQDAVKKINKFTKSRSVVEIPTFLDYYFSQEELLCKEHILFKDRNKSVYLSDLLFYHISNDPKMDKNEKVNKIKEFISIAYAYRRIIFLNWLSFLSLSDTLDIFIDEEFHLMYNISAIEWSGGHTGRDRSLIIVWDKVE